MSKFYKLRHQAVLAGMGADEPQGASVPVVRTYEPGYRPWIAFHGLGADPIKVDRASTIKDPNAPNPITTGIFVAIGLTALGLVALNTYLGYYVGKKLGTRWGWFWGWGGPLGLAGMTLYRQKKGRIEGTGVFSSNRRRRRRGRGRRWYRRNPPYLRTAAAYEKPSWGYPQNVRPTDNDIIGDFEQEELPFHHLRRFFPKEMLEYYCLKHPPRSLNPEWEDSGYPWPGPRSSQPRRPGWYRMRGFRV